MGFGAFSSSGRKEGRKIPWQQILTNSFQMKMLQSEGKLGGMIPGYIPSYAVLVLPLPTRWDQGPLYRLFTGQWYGFLCGPGTEMGCSPSVLPCGLNVCCFGSSSTSQRDALPPLLFSHPTAQFSLLLLLFLSQTQQG